MVTPPALPGGSQSLSFTGFRASAKITSNFGISYSDLNLSAKKCQAVFARTHNMFNFIPYNLEMQIQGCLTPLMAHCSLSRGFVHLIGVIDAVKGSYMGKDS